MSGTSADGIDCAIIDYYQNGKLKVLAFKTFNYPKAVREEIFKSFEGKSNSAGISNLNFLLGELFADSVIKLCRLSKIKIGSLDVIGSHGQTIYHNPYGQKLAGRKIRSTFQIGEPSIIANQTKVLTVADFRTADMAAGGQGAPLVPYTDFLLFASKTKSRVIQNIGGIANLTFIPQKAKPADVIAFDTGPGNMVIDKLTQKITNNKLKYDKQGKIASRGKVDIRLLSKLMDNKYFKLAPPKTTGRELFGTRYADRLYETAKKSNICDNDIIATATAWTAISIVKAYQDFLPNMPDELILCGGGSRNRTLVKMLSEKLAKTKIIPMETFGINPDSKEAVSFAMLACETVRLKANNLPAATNASENVILGKIALP